MIKFFLKAKHWHLFSIFLGIFVIYLISIFSLGIYVNKNSSNFETVFLPNMILIFTLIFILTNFVFMSWLWSIGVGLNKSLPHENSLNIKTFKTLFYFVNSYIFIIFIISNITSRIIFDPIFNEYVVLLNNLYIVIIPVHLFSIFCLIYLLYFVSKTIKSIELMKEVKFGEFVGELFLFWLFPVGIWFIQPRINKIIENDS